MKSNTVGVIFDVGLCVDGSNHIKGFLKILAERNSAPTGANETVHEMNEEASDPLGVATCSD
jgi:hypothetical protein